MTKIILTLALGLYFTALPTWAGKTSIYEQEEVKMQSFTAKVKSVRDAGDEGIDVTFESDVATGFYSLSPKKVKNFDQLQQYVEKSRKAGGPLLKVSAEKEEKIIHGLSIAEKPATTETPSGKVDQKDADAVIEKILKGN